MKNGLFPFKIDCKIVAVDFRTLEPIKVLINERGRYNDLVFSNNLEHLIFTRKDCKECKQKIWIQPLE